MDILDLEEADFIQYKPAETNWPKPEEFIVTNVKRDREWFATIFTCYGGLLAEGIISPRIWYR
jgi:hypothetical protein